MIASVGRLLIAVALVLALASASSAWARPEFYVFDNGVGRGSWTPEQQAQTGDFDAPSLLSLYGRAWWHAIERPFDLVATLIKLLPLLLSDDDTDHTAVKRATPQTPFNRHVDADRVVGHVRLDTTQLRKLVKKQHCTINDIALCVVAGALRAYLLEENALPEDDLQTLMPIDIRREGEDGSLGNHVSVARVCLYTSISDVRERLLAISADSSHSKKRSKKPAAHAMLDLVDEGSSWEEVEQLALAVEAAGATIINTGIGWHEARVPTIATLVPRGAYAWVTMRLMGKLSIPLIATNRINTPEKAEEFKMMRFF